MKTYKHFIVEQDEINSYLNSLDTMVESYDSETCEDEDDEDF